MDDEGSDLKAMWLHLLTEGGQWTVREITRALPYIEQADARLSKAASRGYLRCQAREINQTGRTFGVTRNCKVPRGMTLKELETALFVLQKRPEESENQE